MKNHIRVKFRQFLCVLMTAILCFTLFPNGQINVHAEQKTANVLIWSTCTSNGSYATQLGTFLGNTQVASFAGVDSITVTNQADTTTRHFSGTEELTQYDMVVLWMPNVELNNSDITVLKNYVAKGGRVVMHGEWNNMCESENVILSRAATSMGATFSITSNDDTGAENEGIINQSSDVIGGRALSGGNIKFAAVAQISYSGNTQVIATSTNKGYAGIVDLASGKGRITAISDINWWCTMSGNYLTAAQDLWGRLLSNSISNMELVEEGGNPNSNHEHHWVYSEESDGISVYCDGQTESSDCAYYGIENKMTLILDVFDKNYSGTAYQGAGFDADALSAFNKLTGNQISSEDIEYYLDSELTNSTTAENSGAASDKAAPKYAGTYYAALTVQGKTVKKAFEIKQISQTATVTMNGYTYSEDETATVPKPGVSGAKENPEIKYYYNTTASIEGAEEWKDIEASTLMPDTYYMYAVLEATKNYKETTTEFTPFVIENGTITTVTAEPVEKTYDGKETGITLTGVPEGATVKYGLSASACNLDESPTIKNVADSPCTIYYSVQKDGYTTKTGSASVTINPRTAELVWGDASFVYDGTMQAPSVSVGNLAEGDACLVTVSGSGKDAGDDYTAEASALNNPNYVLPEDATKTFSITKRPLDLVWQAKTTFTYNGKEQEITATPGNVVDGDTVTLIYKDNMKKEVGAYTAVVTGIDNENYVLPAIAEQSYKIEKQTINSDDNKISIRFDKDGNEKVYCEVDGEQIELIEDVDYTAEKTEDGYIKIVGIGGYDSEMKVKQPEASGDGRIVTTVVVETEIEEIQPTLTPVTETNAKNTLLNVIKSEEVKAKVDAGENIEYDATLYLKLLNANETASGDDKALVAKQILDDNTIPSYAKVGMYLDLTLYMSYSVSDVSGVLESGTDKIKDTSDDKMGAGKGYNQEVTITIPVEMRNTDEKIKRSYYVIRVHEDESGTKTAEQVESSQNEYNLTFITDKFSVYAVAYSDEVVPEIEVPEEVTPDNPETPVDTKVEEPTTETVPAPTTVNDASPATGDMAAPFAVMTLMGLTFVMIVALGAYKKKKKD